VAPLGDSCAKVLGGVDYPHECRADSFDDDGVRGWFGIHLRADAVVGLTIEDRGVDVRAQAGDPTGDPLANAGSASRRLEFDGEDHSQKRWGFVDDCGRGI
jgi:hypothetical protein